MKKYSTLLSRITLTFFIFITFYIQKSNAQCFTGNTKDYLVLDSFPGVRDFVEDDFTGDSIPDLAITFLNDTLPVEILRNNGNDNFSVDTSFKIPDLNNIIEGDLNGDGKPDLIIQLKYFYYYGYSIACMNQGNGKFRLDTINLFIPNRFVDLNNDKKDDAFTITGHYSFSVSINMGNDSFAAPVTYTLPFLIGNQKFTQSFALADINGDKFTDILLLDESNGLGVVTYLNDGAGNFIPSKNIPLPFDPLAMHVADMNGDSLPDIIVQEHRLNGIHSFHILLQDSSGAFHQSTVTGLGASIYNYYFNKISAQDINGDGKTDMVAMLTTGDVSVWFGNGKGQIDSSKYYAIRSITSPDNKYGFALKLSDLNRDGNPDIAVLNQTNQICFMLNDGKGNFGHSYIFSTPPFGFLHFSIGDVKNDGKPEILASGGGGVLLLSYSEDSGLKIDTVLYFGTNVVYADFTNLNRDSLADIVFVEYPNNNKLICLINEGNFHFSASDSFPFVPFYPETGSYTLADFNGDGTNDLAITNFGNITLWLNNGSGQFTQQINVSPTGGYLAAADVDKDGNMDIVVGNSSIGTLTIYKNIGNASFTSYTVNAPVFVASTMCVADLNGDGYPDIVAAGGVDQSRSIVVLLNDGTGHFSDFSYDDAGGLDVQQLHVADMNGDGKPDLLYCLFSEKVVRILFNNGNGTFGNPVTFPQILYYVNAFAPVDLNLDKKNDLLITYSDVINYYINCDTGIFSFIPNLNETIGNVLGVYPNPSTGSFTVSLRSEELSQSSSWLTIFNIYGEKIYQQKLIFNQNNIMQNVTPINWANGIYFIKMESGSKNWETKFIKQ